MSVVLGALGCSDAAPANGREQDGNDLELREALGRDDAGKLLTLPWEEYSEDIAKHYANRYPVLRYKDRAGFFNEEAIECMGPGEKVNLGEEGGVVAWSTIPSEIGKRGVRREQSGAFHVGNDELALSVLRSDQRSSWYVLHCNVQIASMLSKCDGSLSVSAFNDSSLATLRVLLLLHKYRVIRWSAKMEAAEPDAALLKKLRAVRELAPSGLPPVPVHRVYECFHAE